MAFLFILVGLIVLLIFFRTVCCSWTQFWPLDMLFHVFLANPMALVKFKKG